MKHTKEFMLMIANFLYGDYGAEDFSQELPAALSTAYEAFLKENVELCDLLEEKLPGLCAAFDPYGTGDPDTVGEAEFRKKVLAVYQAALPLSMKEAS